MSVFFFSTIKKYDIVSMEHVMEEQNDYKDNFLIPILRKKLNDVTAMAVEMEATIIYQNAKINELTEQLKKINISTNSSSFEDAPNVVSSKTRKKQSASSDGGSF